MAEKERTMERTMAVDLDRMADRVAEKALDEFTYKDKTLREWVEIIVAQDLLAIAELEKIKKKLILKLSEGFDFGITEALNIIDEELSELKGENKEECTSDSCDKCDNRFNCTGYQLEWERINGSEESEIEGE